MNVYRSLKNQAGFTLVQAIFILLVLAFLGTAMMRLSGVQSSTSIFALQGARAYQAARSGLDWGAAQAVVGNCATGSEIAIESFRVTVGCTSSADIDEGGSATYRVYRLTALAEYGSYGSPDYVQRNLRMKVKAP